MSHYRFAAWRLRTQVDPMVATGPGKKGGANATMSAFMLKWTATQPGLATDPDISAA